MAYAFDPEDMRNRIVFIPILNLHNLLVRLAACNRYTYPAGRYHFSPVLLTFTQAIILNWRCCSADIL